MILDPENDIKLDKKAMPSKSTKIAPCFAFFGARDRKPSQKWSPKGTSFWPGQAPKSQQITPWAPSWAPDAPQWPQTLIFGSKMLFWQGSTSTRNRCRNTQNKDGHSRPMPVGTFLLFECGQSPQSSIEARWRVRRVARWIYITYIYIYICMNWIRCYVI